MSADGPPTPAELEAFFRRQRPRRQAGCFVCGAPTDVQVFVQIREVTERGSRQPTKGGRSRGRNRSLCAEHGIALYDLAVSHLDSPNGAA